MESGRKMGTNAVEVEPVTEHQLPETHRLDLERLDGTEEREAELKMTSERQRCHRRKRMKTGVKLTEAE